MVLAGVFGGSAYGAPDEVLQALLLLITRAHLVILGVEAILCFGPQLYTGIGKAGNDNI